ncbi:uncharacterized protein LOC135384661 [Ornithodoros turicata]|uniref:uncharacterized protein LOC135384661 n=1 Tax=Ornithodoros turicata TaxID=34597 RepID=UPI0031399113
MGSDDEGVPTTAAVRAGNFSMRSPQEFDFAVPAQWPLWIQQFEDFSYASGLFAATEEVKVRTLLYCMGQQARVVLNSLTSDEKVLKSFELVKSTFTDHFVHPVNELYESSKFHKRVQLPGETVDCFYSTLQNMVRRCNYKSSEVEQRLVRDRFVVGLLDARLSDHLCRNAKLTLAEALVQARQQEDADKERASQGQPQAVNIDSARTRRKKKQTKPQDNGEEHEDKATCSFCGREPHTRSACPAKAALCRLCHKRGHFAIVCRARRSKNLNSIQLFAISASRKKGKFVEVFVDGIPLLFKVDSGAEVTVIPSTFGGIPEQLQAPDGDLVGPGSHSLRTDGTFTATLAWKEKVVTQKIYVVEGLETPLLGFPAIEALGVVKFVDQVGSFKRKSGRAVLHVPVTESAQKAATASVHDTERGPSRSSDIFKGLGTLKEEYTIRLQPNAVPFSLMVVPKISGGYRLCVDLTKLNEVVQRERHIIPTVEQALGLLGEAKVFSKLDATSGFNQVKLAPESQELTTFITPFGRYCYQRLPFGITSAPEFFQRVMAQVLEGQEGVVNMIDHVLVFGKDRKEHGRRLESVLSRLRNAGLSLNSGKCVFGKSSVKFLGVVVDERGISPDPDKVEAIVIMKPPDSVAGVRRLLGMANHIGRFLPNLSQVTAPIRALLNKNSIWVWGAEQQQAFDKLKQMLVSDRCLARYNPAYPTTVSGMPVPLE